MVILAVATLLFSAKHEGYWSHISLLFWAALGCGVLIGLWATWFLSPQRIAAIIAVSCSVEYVKEGLGIEVGGWRYSDMGGRFSLGVASWVLVTLAACALATKVAVRGASLARWSLPGWMRPALICVIACSIPALMGPYRAGTTVLYWMFYGGLLLVCVLGAMRMRWNVFLGVIVTAWALSFPSEYSGSVGSGIWMFTYDAKCPPFFLLVGCWPVEILAQYILSGFICGEPLSTDPSAPSS